MLLSLLKLFGKSIIFLIWLIGNVHAQGTLIPVPKLSSFSENISPFGYYEYLPPQYQIDSTVDFPLIIYLHGLGDKGNGRNELDSVLRSGVAHFLNVGNDLPFLVMSPQSGIGWWNEDGVNRFLDFILDTYQVDSNRVYVTGLSAGGIGVFSYAAAYPDRLAAIVPITGRANNNIEVCNLRKVPTWAFHNKDDPIFNPNFSINSVAALNGCQPTPSPLAKVTIYPSGGHDAWTKTYDGTGMGTEDLSYAPFDTDIFDWMLQFAKDTLIANFAGDQVLFYPENDILIENYAASPDGQHSYSWVQLTGPDLDAEQQIIGNLSYQNVPTDNYSFLLTITDSFNRQISDTININVRPPNSSPIVEAGADQTLLFPLDSITFSAMISDPEQDSITFEWVQITDTSDILLQENNKELILRDMPIGNYTFQLSATDQYDSIAQDIVHLVVLDPPQQIVNNLPYQDSFENTNEEAWQSYGANNSWAQGQPSGSVINLASNESKVWATNPAGDYQIEESSFLLSPVFDFSDLSNDPTIRYDVWTDTAPGDSTYLSVTFDQGVTWESYNLTDENTSDGWTSVSRILEGVAGQESVLFRIGIESHSTERYEGIAIDNMLVCSAGNIVSISDTTVIGGGSLSIPIQLDNPDIIEASFQVSSNNQEILADENLSVSGNTLQINSSTEAKGDAIITIFSPDACIAETSFTLTVDQITALDDQLDKSSQVQLHPNPSTGNYQIKSKEAIREVRVYSPTGQLLKQYTYLSDTNWELSINIYGQPNGIYYFQVETDDNVLTRKVIKY